MLARGALGNPWLFDEVLGARDRRADPRARCCAELDWTIDAPSSTSARTARALPAQVLPLVRARCASSTERAAAAGSCSAATARAALATAARCRRAARTRALTARRACSRPRYTAALAEPSARPFPARSRALLRRRRNTNPRRGHMPKDVILTPEGLRSSRRSSTSSPPRSAARSPSGSRRRASSATSPRTPSTTTPRTSRRCSRPDRPAAGEAADGDRHRGRGSLHRRRARRVGRPRQGREDRQVGEYTIVGSAEAKPAENKLSNESPVGRALLGHRRNDTVAVQVRAGPRAS